MLSNRVFTYSGNLPSVAASSSLRAFFDHRSGIGSQFGTGRLDLDWEYPNADPDASNFVRLLKELYAVSRHGSITLTIDIAGMDKYLDFWNLMGDDIAGSRSTVSGNQANLYVTDVSVDDAVERHMAAGVDKKKINMHATMHAILYLGVMTDIVGHFKVGDVEGGI
ncbi:glycoside hydrolase superfamily [Lipomyces starkeyi]